MILGLRVHSLSPNVLRVWEVAESLPNTSKYRLILKILKQTATNFKELEKLNVFLEKSKIELHQTVYNGIIYFINGKFYKYYQEGQYPTSLPPLIEGCYVECDANGNTDYYQK
jgi:hypothetical protein